MAQGGFEQVIALNDPSCGLTGFMVIHDTTRGPAAGGIRLYPYPNEEEALADGFKLARAMTLKSAAADLTVGGGKVVLIEHSDLIRKEALRAVGRTIQSLGGRFLAGRDVGLPIEQGEWVRSETAYMVDETETGVGDLNLATARGVEAGARAALRFQHGATGWKGIRVAVQGAGGVGRWLSKILAAEGAEITVADPQESRLEQLGREVDIKTVCPSEIYGTAQDVFCPCAVGGTLNEATADKLRARIVAGSANNVLAEPIVGRILFQRGIVYAPDYLVNAGALIQGIRFLLAGERDSSDVIRGIGDKTLRILEMAKQEGVPPETVLDRDTRSLVKHQKSWRDWTWPELT
jgi:leucine dehydrogenase